MILGGVRVSGVVHILHPSRKVTIYGLTVRIFLRTKLAGNGHTESRVCPLVRIDVVKAKVKNNTNMGYKYGQ